MAKYRFKGYTITNCGYHQPDHCVWWEAVDKNGEACFHGNTLREVEFMILDYEWEQKMQKMREVLESAYDALRSAEKYVYGDPPNGEALGWGDVWPSEWHNAIDLITKALSLKKEGGAE